jgi:anti-sigma factor RsiW
MSVTCPVLSERLDQYVDGELAPDARRDVEAHLAACAACRGTRSAIERLGDLVRRQLSDPAGGAASAGVFGAIEARLDETAANPHVPDPGAVAPRRRLRSWRRSGPLIAAAAVLAAVAISLPLASRWFATSPSAAATVASVEGGEASSVVLLAGDTGQAPVIFVTDTGDPGGDWLR